MSQDPTKEEIIRILGLEQPNQEIDLEQFLMNSIVNPQTQSTTRTRVMHALHNGVISETKEASRIHEAGFIEDLKEERIYMLDDGTSLSGVARCQTCQGLVKESNLHRCGCGRTCCVRPGCGKFSKSAGEWYCSTWHAFLNFLTVPLR